MTPTAVVAVVSCLFLIVIQRCCDATHQTQQPYNCPQECICLSSTQVRPFFDDFRFEFYSCACLSAPPSEDNSGGADPIMKGAAVDQFM